MKKYYNIILYSYIYGNIGVRVEEYYLIKEGWIECQNYKEDPNDYNEYSYNHPGTNRNSFCIDRHSEIDKTMFEKIEDAMEFALLKLDKLYKEENFTLLNAYNKALKDVKSIAQ